MIERTPGPTMTVVGQSRPKPGRSVEATPSFGDDTAIGRSPCCRTILLAEPALAPLRLHLAFRSPGVLPCLHPRRHALQTFDLTASPQLVVSLWSICQTHLAAFAPWAGVRYVFEIRLFPETQLTAAAVHDSGSRRSQKQPTAAFTIFQFNIFLCAFQCACEIHNCPFIRNKCVQKQKSPGADCSAQGSFLLR